MIKVEVTGTDNIWNASHLEYGDGGSITAFLVARAPGHGELFCGGGLLQEWRSDDWGKRWRRVGDLNLPGGFLANNPKSVEDSSGAPLKRTLLLFGLQGPRAIKPAGPFCGQAYLWRKWEAEKETTNHTNITNAQRGKIRVGGD